MSGQFDPRNTADSSFFDPSWFERSPMDDFMARRDQDIANEIAKRAQQGVVDLSGGKPPDHFANQGDMRKAEEMERRLVNLLQRAKSVSHSLCKAYEGAVPTPSNWERAQRAITDTDRAVTEAAYRARQLRTIRRGRP